MKDLIGLYGFPLTCFLVSFIGYFKSHPDTSLWFWSGIVLLVAAFCLHIYHWLNTPLNK